MEAAVAIEVANEVEETAEYEVMLLQADIY